MGALNGAYANLLPCLPKVTIGVVFALHMEGLGAAPTRRRPGLQRLLDLGTALEATGGIQLLWRGFLDLPLDHKHMEGLFGRRHSAAVVPLELCPHADRQPHQRREEADRQNLRDE